MSRYSILIFSLFCCFFISCKQATKHTGTSFYYWKVSPDTADLSPTLLKQFQVKELYIKLAEINYDEAQNAVYPLSKLTRVQVYKELDKITFIPVIFMANKALQHSDSAAIKLLAYRSFLLIKDYSRLLSPDSAAFFSQVQIDCDWTKETKDKYFYYLLELKKHLHQQNSSLSVTLRLYPYKYPAIMGVPPADRAMLMCYNLDNVRLTQTQNSILDLATLEKYLQGKQQYPLALDAALPLFDWYAWYRNEQFMGLVYTSELEDLKYNDYATTILEDSAKKLILTQEITVGNKYLRAGDILRKEYISQQMLEQADQLLHQKTKVEKITFFHFDRQLLKKYPELLSLD